LDRIWTLFKFFLMILSRFWAVWSRLWTKDGHILDTHFRHSLDGFLTYFERNLSWFWTESGHFFLDFLIMILSRLEQIMNKSWTYFGYIGTYFTQILDIFWAVLEHIWIEFGHIFDIFWTYVQQMFNITFWKMDKLLTYIKQILSSFRTYFQQNVNRFWPYLTQSSNIFST